MILIGGAMLVVALAWVSFRDRFGSAPPPIAAPANLGELDPQVRSHLVALATEAGKAPGESRHRSELGLALAVNGLWADARTSFLNAIQLGEPGPLPGMYAAVALQEMGDPAGAALEFERLVEQFPGAGPAWYRLGLARIALGEMKAAEDAFSRVTRLTPEEWRGWAGLGEVRLRQGRAAEALEPLERAVQLDPLARTAYHLLGQAYQATGRPSEAAAARAAGRSQTVGPMPDAWSPRALAHMRLLPDQFEKADALIAAGRFPDAIGLLREALRFHPTNVSVVVRLARALTASGGWDEAGHLLESARLGKPDEPGLLVASSEAAAAGGRVAEALELARRVVELTPRWAEAHVAEANARLAAGEDGAAVEALECAHRHAPTEVGLLLQIGDIEWRNLGQREKAWERFHEAYALDPIHPGTLERMTELAIERGALEEAEKLLSELGRLRVDGAAWTELEAALRRRKAGR
ncbi:MAG: tetratricopeptide repeat protein [Limisphaerales bacterium]